MLPAVSSLKALRRVAKPSAATKPMIGFGNPLLDGDPAERPWEAEWAKLARAEAGLPADAVAAGGRPVRAAPRRACRWQRAAAVADLDHLRSQTPLPDTADELCAVAKDLKLAPDDILLGARATETSIKTLSDAGQARQVPHACTSPPTARWPARSKAPASRA